MVAYFRAFTNFKAVLPVNNSLIHWLLLGLTTHYCESYPDFCTAHTLDDTVFL